MEYIDFALKEAEKVSDYAEVRYEKFEATRISCKNSNIEVSEIDSGSGIAIRIIKDGKMGIGFTNKYNRNAIKDVIKRALKMASRAKNKIELSDEKSYKSKYTSEQKKKLKNVSIEEKINYLIDLDKFIRKKVPMRFFSYSDEIREKVFVNTDGSYIRSVLPRVGFEYSITLISGGNSNQRVSQFGMTAGFEAIKEFKLERNLLNDIQVLEKLFKAKKITPGRYDIVLGPEVVGIASHESCGHPYEADRILGREAAQAGESFVTPDMLGKKIGSDVVNVVDDPRIPKSYGFYLYDDEGVKARKRYLIKNGVINEFLQNRETAAEFGIKSNAAARACEWDVEPIVRMANTFVAPGDYKFDEMISDVRRGIYIRNFMEWNIDDKRYNQRYIGLEAYEIRNGKIKNMVKNPILEITTPTFWKSVDAVGKRVEFVAGTCGKGDPMQGIPVYFGGPHIRLKNIFMV